MVRLTVVLFLAGVAAAFCFAAWQYSSAPQGMLLYTPAPGATPNYAASSAVGFIVASLGLSAVSALVAVISLVAGLGLKRRPLQAAKMAFSLSISFGVLCAIAAFTEKLWP